MSDIQVPDEVIEEAAKAQWDASEGRIEDGLWAIQDDRTKSLWCRGPAISAPIIAAWARKQAWQDLSRLLGEMLTERPKELEEDTYWHGRWVALRALKADLDDETIDALLAETKDQ